MRVTKGGHIPIVIMFRALNLAKLTIKPLATRRNLILRALSSTLPRSKLINGAAYGLTYETMNVLTLNSSVKRCIGKS